MSDIEAIDSELRSVAALRGVAREGGWPLPSTAVADALLDERLRADRSRLQPANGSFSIPDVANRAGEHQASPASG
jgi:hypothetical protein